MTLALDRRAELWGNRPAVTDHHTDETLSYSELDRLVDRHVAALAAAGVEPGDAVVVLSQNRPAFLALFWATRRLDATLAPVSHRLPADTVARLCERIDPSLILADGAGTSPAPTGWPIRDLPDFAPERPPTSLPEEPAERAAPRLYLHTGGTTGTPKVVVIEARQVEWNCITEVAAWGLGKRTVAPTLLPMFHTGGWLLLTLPTLYVGGHVVLLRSFDPGETLAAIEAHGATNVFGVAAIFEAMADHERFGDTDLSSVEWFMSGGGPTPAAVMRPYRDRGATFVQGYGLTEGGPNNLYVEPGREDAHEKPDRVGRPFPDCRIRIVDDSGRPVDTGAVGELEVAGPVTAERYLETTDGTFEGQWVSTGDLALRDEEGDVAIVGRTDNMFISGGENVHPESIERALESHPGVEMAGVVGVPHDRWGTVPRAVVVGHVGEAALRDHAEERLADYERPTEYVFVDDLPRSGPGKLDRQALQAEYCQ